MEKRTVKETVIAPVYYKKFQCAASRCEDTCCQGWNIAIDQKTWKKYRSLSKQDRAGIQKGLDKRHHSFRIADSGKCVFLDEQSLCRVQKKFGEEMLCDTCRRYPRHMEEYEGLREFSLSLSCPEAARMILEDREKLRFDCVTRERKIPVRKQKQSVRKEKKFLRELLAIRKKMFQIAQDRALEMEERMGMILLAASHLQKAVDQGERSLEGTIDWNEIRKERRKMHGEHCSQEERFLFMMSSCEIFSQLEPIQEEWKKRMEVLWRALYCDGVEEYAQRQKEYETEDDEMISEKLFVYFLFVYFLGGIYDRQFETKVKFAVFGWFVIREWAMMRKKDKGEIMLQDWVEFAYRYSREVEHSDQNLEMLETVFERHEMFDTEKILKLL